MTSSPGRQTAGSERVGRGASPHARSQLPRRLRGWISRLGCAPRRCRAGRAPPEGQRRRPQPSLPANRRPPFSIPKVRAPAASRFPFDLAPPREVSGQIGMGRLAPRASARGQRPDRDGSSRRTRSGMRHASVPLAAVEVRKRASSYVESDTSDTVDSCTPYSHSTVRAIIVFYL